MAYFTKELLLRALRERNEYSDIDLFVETGTWKGDTTLLARELFAEVHTVEASKQHFDAAFDRFQGLDINLHLGDSPEVLSRLLPVLSRPAVFYLDAHWFRSEGTSEDNRMPLMQELDVLKEREFADIIIIDDANRFGTNKPCPEWLEVTPKSIIARLGEERVLATVRRGQQFILYMRAVPNA